LLHAPDFLGYPDAIRMAQDHPEIVHRGLELKKLGNDIMTLLGGREIHPVSVKVGGFYRVPARRELTGIKERLKWACDAALETVRWTAGLRFPDFERSYELVALRHISEYPMNEGYLVSNMGREVTADQYEDHFKEEQVAHSNALHSRTVEGGAYHVGPLARYNLSFDRLSRVAREAARSAGFAPPVRNPFKSIVIRSIELFQAAREALHLMETYEPPDEIAVAVEPRAAEGCSLTEAPRGALYHRYRIDEEGHIVEARIVPPTAQNQKVMEDDLRELALRYQGMPQKELTWLCEQAIRNYDPCISCATH
jgi:coenzyme F420-reducing hydrogenase alpha subunit